VGGVKREISLAELKGKRVAVDAYNAFYQFLAAIRQPDGTPLMDKRGNVTSHLSGLFYRTINLVESGIIPVYVFDGKPPEMKTEEIERRKRVREEARRKYERAKEEGRVQEQRKYAQASTYLTKVMIADCVTLLEAMGIPHVQAPSEGEAEAAHLNRRGLTWATGSQDYDSILFGAIRLVRNLTISGKRKLPNKDIYVEVKPEMLETEPLLKSLGISRTQLIDVAILVGTDFNPGGVKGIGPKTALKLVKEYGSIEGIINAGKIDKGEVDFDVDSIRKIFMSPEVVDPKTELELGEPKEEQVYKVLVESHDFDPERVKAGLARLRKALREARSAGRQKGLDQWF
jgi:flap endonuclease-1